MRAPPEDYQSIRTDSSREKRMAPTFNRDSEKGDVSTAAVHGLIVPVQRHATHSTSATGKMRRSDNESITGSTDTDRLILRL